MSICPLEVLVIIAAPKRAVVHQLQSDMNRNTIIFGYDIPTLVYVVEDSLLEENISSSVHLMAQHACHRKEPLQWSPEMHPVLLLLLWLMSRHKAATNLQSVCLQVHCHAA